MANSNPSSRIRKAIAAMALVAVATAPVAVGAAASALADRSSCPTYMCGTDLNEEAGLDEAP